MNALLGKLQIDSAQGGTEGYTANQWEQLTALAKHTGKHRVLVRPLVDWESCVIMGLESDRPATLAWLESLEVDSAGGV